MEDTGIWPETEVQILSAPLILYTHIDSQSQYCMREESGPHTGVVKRINYRYKGL